MALDRRAFVKISGLAGLGLAAGGAASLVRQETPGAASVPPVGTGTVVPAPGEAGGPAVDAAKTLTGAPGAKPLVGKRWAMVVDVNACLRDKGCDKCTAACHETHNVPDFPNPKDEVKWIWKEPFVEALPDAKHDYLPASLRDGKVLVFCNHCDNPPCTDVCPTGATWKRDDGVVMMDWHRCIGCRYCVAACPYGSRSFNWREPRPFLTKVDPAFPTRTRGVVEKCNLCEDRLAQGQAPACVGSCDEKALVFGDLEDPDSEVRRLLAERPAARRRPALGTQPQVYYLL